MEIGADAGVKYLGNKLAMVKEKKLEELVSDDVAIFLKQQGSAVTVVPFREPMIISLDSDGNLMHPGKIITSPMFNQKGWNKGYTRGGIITEIKGGQDRVVVQYYRYKVGVYDPPGN